MKDNSLSSLKHSLTNHGSVLTLHSVTRAASGLYLCQARNGVGQPATDHIKLHVLYAPHVHAVHHVVEGGAGHKAVMVCIVHAEPVADVVWYKNSMQLDMRRDYIISKDNKRYFLTVPKVGEEDFANYTCQASNSLGNSVIVNTLRSVTKLFTESPTVSRQMSRQFQENTSLDMDTAELRKGHSSPILQSLVYQPSLQL